MRIGVWFAVLALGAAACGSSGDAPSAQPSSFETTVAASFESPTTASPPSPTSAPPSPQIAQWTVALLGRDPVDVVSASGALGSGCTPGAGLLPDGVWFGWASGFAPDVLEFDLACLWPGRLEVAAGNDSSLARSQPVSADALVYEGDGAAVPYAAWWGTAGDLTVANAPTLLSGPPLWVFVNAGWITEMAVYPQAINWARVEDGWPGLVPGCCGEGPVAPPSPDVELPDEGWPADGFYGISVDEDQTGALDVSVFKWLSCDEHPDLCPAWWEGNEVTSSPNMPQIQRALTLDDGLTVVINPIGCAEVRPPIVGTGAAFADLVADMRTAVAYWLEDGETSIPWSSLPEFSADPEFPFGVDVCPEFFESLPGYRGPGGTHLTWTGWWYVLEIRDGLPIVYVDAGMVAG